MLNRIFLPADLLGGLRRCFSSSIAVDASKLVLRNANKIKTNASIRERLAKVSRPFRELVASYLTADQANSSALGYNLQPSDLTNLGLESSDVALTRILSLEMCSPAHVRQYYLHAAMEMFARRPNDTGSPEVQAALWSVKIEALEAHVKSYRHDYVAERKIVEWRDQRRKILRYLKRVSLERYYLCLDRLGLPHDLVESVVSRFPRDPIRRERTAKGLLKLRAAKHQ